MVAGMTSVQLDDEARVALGRSARMAGVPAPALLALAGRYLHERARETGEAPTPGRAAEALDDAAKLVRKLARKLGALNPWTKGALPDGGEAVAHLQPCLTAAEMILDRGAREVERQRRQRLDRGPGTATWRFAWALADLWAETGRNVAGSFGSAFRTFSVEVFDALKEPLPERLTRELADRWRAAAERTFAAPKPAPASGTGPPTARTLRPVSDEVVAA
jgi:hypothetical protein